MKYPTTTGFHNKYDGVVDFGDAEFVLGLTAAEIAERIFADPNLNNIPLAWWDHAAREFIALGWRGSLAEAVCALKHAAAKWAGVEPVFVPFDDPSLSGHYPRLAEWGGPGTAMPKEHKNVLAKALHLTGRISVEPYGFLVDGLFTGPMGEYIVLTEEEADRLVAENILDSLWAFKPAFLADFTGLPVEVFDAISANNKCEGNNAAIRKLLALGGGEDKFVRAAVEADGRGLFLAGYDHKEIRVGSHYIYRTN